MENKVITLEERVELLERKVQNMLEFIIMEFKEYNEIVERQMMLHIREKEPELYKILIAKHTSVIE